jgi:predicted RNA binding protein YcfA (HicA-like mRNA interferase family)
MRIIDARQSGGRWKVGAGGTAMNWCSRPEADKLTCPCAICYSGRMKVGEILAKLKTDGWFLVATRGSHRQFKHPAKAGRVTVPGKPGDDLAPGTLNSILKQAQLKD